jgi:hypothetical protein
MISNLTCTQHTATSSARKLPLAIEEIAHRAAYRAAAPVGARLRGAAVPTADFQRSRIAPAPVGLMSVGGRNGVNTVPGSVPRGRPV